MSDDWQARLDAARQARADAARDEQAKRAAEEREAIEMTEAALALIPDLEQAVAALRRTPSLNYQWRGGKGAVISWTDRDESTPGTAWQVETRYFWLAVPCNGPPTLRGLELEAFATGVESKGIKLTNARGWIWPRSVFDDLLTTIAEYIASVET